MCVDGSANIKQVVSVTIIIWWYEYKFYAQIKSSVCGKSCIPVFKSRTIFHAQPMWKSLMTVKLKSNRYVRLFSLLFLIFDISILLHSLPWYRLLACCCDNQGSLLLTGFNFSHYLSFPNYKSATVEVWEWISDFIPHFTWHVVAYPCRD